jgi:hypothetical protein
MVKRSAVAACLGLWAAACSGGSSHPDAGSTIDAGPAGLTITYSVGTSYSEANLGATATIAEDGSGSTHQTPDAGSPWYGDMQTATYSAQNSGEGATASSQLTYTLTGTTLTFTGTTQANATTDYVDGTAAARLSGTLTVQAPGLTQVTLQTNCSGTVEAQDAGLAEIDLSGDHGPYNSPLNNYCASACNFGSCSQWTAFGEPDGPTASVTIPAVDGVVAEGLTMYIGCLAGTYDGGSNSCSANGTITVDITPTY